MKTLVIVGDPGNIAASLTTIYKNNPKLKIVCATAAQHFMPHPGKIMSAVGAGQAIPCQAYYLTFTGVDIIIDEYGKPVEGQI